MLADLSHGHVDLADWLFLIAAVMFFVVAIIRALPENRTIDAVLMPLGATFLAFALFVL